MLERGSRKKNSKNCLYFSRRNTRGYQISSNNKVM